ncbi:MAG: hypothetical protein ACTIJY_00535 [Luteimonas sp.]
MYKSMLPALIALAVATSAHAAMDSRGDAFAPEKGLDLSGVFDVQRTHIIRALADGDTYNEIAAQDSQIVQSSLNRIAGLLNGVRNVDELPESAKVQVYNEQERINSLLVPAYANSRVICRREKPTGSNRPINICLTVAERRRAREGAEDFLRYNPRAQARPDNK